MKNRAGTRIYTRDNIVSDHDIILGNIMLTFLFNKTKRMNRIRFDVDI